MDRDTYKKLRAEFWTLMAENGYTETLPTTIPANVFWPAVDKLKKSYDINNADDFETLFNFQLTF